MLDIKFRQKIQFGFKQIKNSNLKTQQFDLNRSNSNSI